MLPQHQNIPSTKIPTLSIPTSSKSAIRYDKIETNDDTTKAYYTEDTPALLSHAGSNSDLSLLSIPIDKSKKDYSSDESSNISGDNDNILAECIESGMPKRKENLGKPLPRGIPLPNSANNSPIKMFKTQDSYSKNPKSPNWNKFPNYLAANDECSNYALENSPYQYSVRSSLSDLTVDEPSEGLKM